MYFIYIVLNIQIFGNVCETESEKEKEGEKEGGGNEKEREYTSISGLSNLFLKYIDQDNRNH